jgi:hypothetical protein
LNRFWEGGRHPFERHRFLIALFVLSANEQIVLRRETADGNDENAIEAPAAFCARTNDFAPLAFQEQSRIGAGVSPKPSRIVESETRQILVALA